MSTTKTHAVNGIVVEQRMADGFINGTAMCKAYRKLISHWLENQQTVELIKALSDDLRLEVIYRNSDISIESMVSGCFPGLIVIKQGSPANGGGTWLHPDLAIQLAQWCSPQFAIQVSRWVRDWIMSQATGNQPGSADEFMSVVRDEIKELRGDVRQLANCYHIAKVSHPGLGELIDGYGKDTTDDIPYGLPNPFILSEWALITGYSLNQNVRRRIAESVKALRKVRYLKYRRGHLLYYHSDLPAFKAVLEGIKDTGSKVSHLHRYQRF